MALKENSLAAPILEAIRNGRLRNSISTQFIRDLAQEIAMPGDKGEKGAIFPGYVINI